MSDSEEQMVWVLTTDTGYVLGVYEDTAAGKIELDLMEELYRVAGVKPRKTASEIRRGFHPERADKVKAAILASQSRSYAESVANFYETRIG